MEHLIIENRRQTHFHYPPLSSFVHRSYYSRPGSCLPEEDNEMPSASGKREKDRFAEALALQLPSNRAQRVVAGALGSRWRS